VGNYILRRLFLMIPTLLGILTVTFIIVQFTPGGPVETVIAQMRGTGGDSLGRVSGSDTGGGGDAFLTGAGGGSQYRGAQGLDPEFIKALEKQFGFDKPVYVRYGEMLWNYIRFDFGDSWFQRRPVTDLIAKALPVSISLGIWQFLLSYLISIPLGIRKAVKDGSSFDVWTSAIVIVGYAVPGFLFGIMLLVFFAGGSFYNWFPLGYLTSDNFDTLSWGGKILDYLWHIALPVTAMVISSFATVTLLTKNCFLEEIRKQYVVTARAKGLSERAVLYGHVFRNAMLVVIAGFPAAFITAFFTGALLLEMLYSLNGIGLLGYDAIMKRDYPVVFGTLFIFSLIGIVVTLISDLIYMWIDPRIDFERRDV